MILSQFGIWESNMVMASVLANELRASVVRMLLSLLKRALTET